MARLGDGPAEARPAHTSAATPVPPHSCSLSPATPIAPVGGPRR